MTLQTIQVTGAALGCLSGVKEAPSTVEDSTLLGHIAWMFQAGIDEKASLVWFSLHGSRKYYAHCQERAEVKQSYPALTPVNHDNYYYGKICIKVQ